MGRFKNDTGQIISKRKRLPTCTYFNESSEMTNYHIKRKEFEVMIVYCGNEEGTVTKRLYKICNQIYDSMISDNPVVLTGYDGWLYEEHVVKVLARFSMPHPDLTYYQRKTGLTSTQVLKYQKTLHMLEVKSFHIVYVVASFENTKD